MLVSPVARLRH